MQLQPSSSQLPPSTPVAVAAETTLPPSDDPVEALRREFDPTKAAVNAMLDWSNKEKRYLAASSVIGTLVWGFGDLLAAWICAA